MEAESKHRIRSLEELPLVMNANDLAEAMGISRAFSYQLMRSENFPTIHIRRRMVVYREDFAQWLKSQHVQNAAEL